MARHGSQQFEDRRQVQIEDDPSAGFRRPLSKLDPVPADAPTVVGAEGQCAQCGGALSAAIALCTRCGAAVPDHAEDPLYLVLRAGPDRPLSRREAVRLLAEAGPDLRLEEVDRQLRDLPALFRAPLPDAMASRLAERLRRCGYRVEVLTEFPSGLGFTEYLASLWSRKPRLLPYAFLLGLTGWLVGLGWVNTATVVAALMLAWGAYDRGRFLRRLTLSAGRLASRVGMLPEEVRERVGALLRDGALSPRLRAPLSALLLECGRLLDALDPMAAQYPDVIRPMRQALSRLCGHAARLADKALSVEKAGDFDDPGLEERLAGLRALGSAEIERRAGQLLAAREQRQERMDWLREIHGTLLVRIESIIDTLRSVRQRVVETYVLAEAESGSQVTDRLLAALRLEQAVVTDTVSELDRLDRHLADLVVE